MLGDPVRRRILELIADGELASGGVCAVIRAEFGISQPAVSQHLRVLRDSGFATVRAEGTRRLYAVNPDPLREVAELAGSVPALLDSASGGRWPRNVGPRPAGKRRPGGEHGERGRELSMIEVIEQINAVRRRVGTRVLEAGEARTVIISQVYAAPVADVWDACTNPGRIPRWFVPVSGDLRARRAVPDRGQREWHHRALRPPGELRGDLGVRRADQLDRGQADRRAGRQDPARDRAHRAAG